MREGWTYKKLGEVCEVTDYVANGSFATLRDNVKYLDAPGYAILVRLADYSNGFDSSKFVYVNQHAYDFLAKSKLNGGEIIMSNVGSLGKLFICPKLDMPMTLAPNSIVIKTSNNPFYYYYFKSNQFQEKLVSISSKTALPKFNKTEFKKLEAPLPPLTTQQQIVSELDLLTHILDQKRQQLKEYDALAESIFYDMFGDPVENPKGWEVKKLGEIGFCCSGGTPSRSNDSFFHGTINWYSAGELNSLFLGESNEKITVDAVNQSAAKLCKVDSLFIGMYDTAAFKLGIATKECCSNQACANICLNEDNVIWLYYTLQQMREEALNNRRGARQKNLNLGYIKSFRVPLPPLPLQHSFAAKIRAIEHQKQLLKESIKETEMLFQSRMDYWFNG